MSKMRRASADAAVVFWIGSAAVGALTGDLRGRAQRCRSSARRASRPRSSAATSRLSQSTAPHSPSPSRSASGRLRQDRPGPRRSDRGPSSGAVMTSIGVNERDDHGRPHEFSPFSETISATQGRSSGCFSIPTHADFATDYFDIEDILGSEQLGHRYVIVVRRPVHRQPGRDPVARVRRGRGGGEPVLRADPTHRSFGDVPVFHPFYQFIEALARSGITGGCGGGNYCPDAPLTRGQMAVFLSKALGLHWPR